MTVETHGIEYWLTIVLQGIGVLIVLLPLIWRLVKAPLETQLTGYGERLNKNELECARTSERASTLEKAQELSAFDRAAIHERMGALEEKFSKFLDSAERYRNDDNKEATQILSRLASIEAKVDIAAPIEKLVREFRRSANDTR